MDTDLNKSGSQVGPSFDEELREVLQEVNAKRPLGQKISFRSAVVNGLVDSEGKRLRDSFCSKITSGTYRPTYDRLVSLAQFLGVPPSRFRTFRERYAERLIRENRDAVHLVDILSQFDDTTASLLLQGATKRVNEIISQVSQKAAA